MRGEEEGISDAINITLSQGKCKKDREGTRYVKGNVTRRRDQRENVWETDRKASGWRGGKNNRIKRIDFCKFT